MFQKYFSENETSCKSTEFLVWYSHLISYIKTWLMMCLSATSEIILWKVFPWKFFAKLGAYLNEPSLGLREKRKELVILYLNSKFCSGCLWEGNPSCTVLSERIASHQIMKWSQWIIWENLVAHPSGCVGFMPQRVFLEREFGGWGMVRVLKKS